MTDTELQIWIGEAFKEHLKSRPWSSACQLVTAIHGVLVHIEIFAEGEAVAVSLAEGYGLDGWKQGRRVWFGPLDPRDPCTIKNQVWLAKRAFMLGLRDMDGDPAFQAQRDRAQLEALALATGTERVAARL